MEGSERFEGTSPPLDAAVTDHLHLALSIKFMRHLFLSVRPRPDLLQAAASF